MADRQTIVAAPTSKAFGRPVPGKPRTVALRAGTAPTVRWQVVDERGCPADLTPYLVGDPPIVPVMLRVIENTIFGRDPDFVAVCTDPAAGTVECTLDLRQLGGPGIYIAEFAVLADDIETVLLSNPFTLLVERGLFGGDPTGLPTLAEIRLRLRDWPQYNELIGDYAWDDSEIVAALQEPVDFWNAALPDCGVYYTTQSWPAQYRHWWIRGAIASLYRIAAAHQRRNQLDYQAGGVAVQDSNRAPEYDQLAEAIWAEFKAWVQSTKAKLNQDQCWGSTGGYYPW